MPKIIENLQSNILDESRAIIDEKGVDALSIRALATRLSIAPSTVYNYYDSKEQIIGALLKRSWGDALTSLDMICQESTDPEKAMTDMVTVLRSTIRPLLQQHIIEASKKKDAARFDIATMVFSPLEQRVKTILQRSGKDEKAQEKMAPVLMKLIITCMFDLELEFAEVLNCIRKL